MSTRARSERELEPVAVVSPAWGRPGDEMAYVVRQVAAALTRLTTVEVFVPGGTPAPDGAFDLRPIESGSAEAAPGAAKGGSAEAARGAAKEGSQHSDFAAVLVDDGDEVANSLAGARFPGVPLISVGAARNGAGEGHPREVPVLSAGVGPSAGGVYQVGSLVAVHPAVSKWQRVRSGVEYLVVLDRGDSEGQASSNRLVRRLSRRFPTRRIVVVGNAVGALWRYGIPVVKGPVSSRTDLWRLMAHAMLTIDLAPGPVISRECVESLRFGVPIVGPAGSPAHQLVAHGVGRSFESDEDLLRQVASLMDPAAREELGRSGRNLADEWYGNPSAFVTRVGDAVKAIVRG